MTYFPGTMPRPSVTALFITIAALPILLLPAPLQAQVGHAPEASPYRDVRFGGYLVGSIGQVYGSGGSAGVAPHSGRTYGLSYRVMANRGLSLRGGVTFGRLERLIQNPSLPEATRTTGPVDQDMVWADFSLIFNLTGGKTWHGLAPYLGAGGGLAFASETPEDLSGFKLGKKFYFQPLIGTRFFLTERVHLEFEAAAQFWQLKYPERYRQPPIEAPDDPPLLATGSLSEWTLTPTLRIGLGWAARLPF